VSVSTADPLKSQGILSQSATKTARTDRFEFDVSAESGYLRKVMVTVEPGHVAAARRKEAVKVGKTSRIKGFRKGKVPPHVVEERYGPLIDERTLSALINQAFRAAVAEHELTTVGEPVVADVDYEPGQRLKFRVDIEVMPEVRLDRTSGFRIERPEVIVQDEDVDELFEKVRLEQAVLEPVDRAPEEGDVVSVVIRAEDDREDAGEDKPYRFEIGEGHAIPDVEAAILTLTPGDEETFEVSYPDDFGSDTLAGTTRSLSIRLDDVRTKRLPEPNDDFARQLGGTFETIDELRTAIREDLVAHREGEANDAARERLIEAVIEANPFEVPPSLLSRYLDQVIDAPEGTDPERVQEARQSVAPAVERQIKRDLILERVIESEGLTPSDEEFDTRLSELGEKQGLSLVEVRRQLAREKQLDSLRHRLAVDKAFQFLMDSSEVI